MTTVLHGKRLEVLRRKLPSGYFGRMARSVSTLTRT